MDGGLTYKVPELFRTKVKETIPLRDGVRYQIENVVRYLIDTEYVRVFIKNKWGFGFLMDIGIDFRMDSDVYLNMKMMLSLEIMLLLIKCIVPQNLILEIMFKSTLLCYYRWPRC